MSTSDSTENRGLLTFVAQTLTSEVSSTTVGELDDDGRTKVASGFESCIDGTEVKSTREKKKSN
jgi:hypothetical protein